MGKNAAFCGSGINKLLSLFALSIALFSYAQATTRLHVGPRGRQVEKVLHGSTKTRPTPSDRSTGQSGWGPPHRVDFSIHFKRDLVIWDELVKDGIEMDSCSFKQGSRYSKVQLSGAKLDVTDFAVGVIFSIEKGDFELNCEKPYKPVEGIDDSDNILFYKIVARTVLSSQSVILKMKLVPGRTVVPIVEVNVSENPAPSPEEDFTLDDEEDISGSSSREISPLLANDTLPTAERFSLFKKTIDVASGVKFNVDAGVKVKLSSFKVVRLLSLEFRWDQTLDAYVRASLIVGSTFKETRTGELGRQFIPGLSFGVSIPLVGKLKAGAFIGINWIVQLNTNVAATLYFNANYKRHEEVTASIIPPSYNAVNKLPPGTGASSSANIVLGTSTTYSFNGFAGIRPVIGAGISYTRTKVSFKRFRLRITKETKSVDGNLGVNVGMQLSAIYMNPAFRPHHGKQLNSVCNSCHHVRANLRFVIKSLSVQTVVGGKVTNEKVLVSSLFDADAGTLCLVQSAVC